MGIFDVFKKEDEKKLNKTQHVMKHLREKGSITSWEAITLYGATRLSAIIYNLRDKGWNIDSVSNSAFDRNNEVCNYTTYELKD